jgi:glyoxylase-like metal-dependent hydrolase (beta-lactamase superfamily II)
MTSHHAGGIHQVPGVRGANAFLVSGAGPLTLIDTGLPGSGKKVIEFMAALGYRPEALDRILVTHRHPDHCGGAASLREATGARLYVHGADAVTQDDGSRVLRTMRGRVTVPVDCLLQDGDVLEGGIEVMHAGGHTAGSSAFYIPAVRALFLGDMAVNNIDRLSRPIAFSNEDSSAYEAGLARLLALDAEAGYFGHGPPLLEGLQAALLALRDRPPSPIWLSVIRYAGLWLRRRLPRG